VGITASTDSWYLGQGRQGYRDYFPSFARTVLADMQAAGVLNFEMEASALLTVAGLYGLRAGAIFAVVANRVEDSFQVTGVERAVSAANRAAVLLARMDSQKAAAGVAFWHPGLAGFPGKGEETAGAGQAGS
jgi:uridine phosphorylase